MSYLEDALGDTIAPLFTPISPHLPISRRGTSSGAQGGGGGQIYALPQFQQVGGPQPSTDGSMKPSDVKIMMFKFIRDFHVGTIHVYR